MKMLHRFSGLLNRLRLPGCIVIFLSFSLSSLLFSGLSYGQDRGIEKNVGKVEKEAAGLFREGDFVKALPLYSQLLSLDPKNPDLNYHFGVCLLQGDRRDMERPLKFLERL